MKFLLQTSKHQIQPNLSVGHPPSPLPELLVPLRGNSNISPKKFQLKTFRHSTAVSELNYSFLAWCFRSLPARERKEQPPTPKRQLHRLPPASVAPRRVELHNELFNNNRATLPPPPFGLPKPMQFHSTTMARARRTVSLSCKLFG